MRAAQAVTALLLVVLMPACVRAGDWTDTDCTRWLGTPQYAECVAAYQQLLHSDCSKWTPGEREFAKCVHAQSLARVRGCRREGMNKHDGDGYPIATHVDCPLANESTGALNGAEPLPPRSGFVTDAPRVVGVKAVRHRGRTQRIAGVAPRTQRPVEIQGPPVPTPRVSSESHVAGAVRTGPLSWSNIRPAHAD
ncbi:MAG: hypothetical protein B6D46_05825 [Polyangiaceae bacterium UTPRO1]|jgi:hypothetical protein|nr:hypothetical protein [Myxococcales bacterium]OQY67541.1 MAG: hypothetical protein B6D46_05825 [Polyangiaceae bacterium UTPRO1]